METLDIVEKEVLEEIIEYSKYIIPAISNVVNELRTDKKEDTSQLLNTIIKGINWEIEVFNNIEVLINKKGTWVDKEMVTEAVGNLGKGLNDKDEEAIATCLEDDFVPFLKSFEKAAQFRLQQENDN